MNIDRKRCSHMTPIETVFITSSKITKSVDYLKTIWRSSYYSKLAFLLNNDKWILINTRKGPLDSLILFL